MASSYRRKRSPFFWLRIKKPDGTWQGINSGIRLDDADGERKLKMRLAKESVIEAAAGPVNAGIRFSAWVPEFLRRHYHHALSLQRANNAWAALSLFLDQHSIEVPSQVTHMVGHEYVGWRQKPTGGIKARSKNTALLEVKILSVIMQEAVKREWASGNPLLRLGIRRDPPKEKGEVTADDRLLIEEALADGPQWMKDAWMIGMKQGCRLRETAVEMSKIDESLMVVQFKVKGGRFHTAPLHADLLPLIKRRRDQGAERLVDLPAMPSKAWHTFFKRLGMAGRISFHSTRVTVVSQFARSANVPDKLAMAYVGHCSATVHRIYQRLRPPDVAHLGELLK